MRWPITKKGAIIMILTNDRKSYINVFHVKFDPKLSVVLIGRLRQTHFIGRPGTKTWKADFIGRNLNELSDRLNGSEKGQIIGTMDKLNGVENREISDLQSRWEQIIRRLP